MDPMLLRLLAVVALVAVVAAGGRWWRARDGAVRAGAGTRVDRRHLDAVGLDLVGVKAGAVLLGSPTCAPCGSVKQLLGELERERDGFRWVYADVADHREVADEHRVLRVPTLLVVDGSGRLLARTSGVPRREELRAVLDGRGRPAEDAAA
jgi:thiol-disulfide isomerase/thioredoxin